MGSNPIIIGGVGGSGTRVFAESLMAAGIRTLKDLNKASDAQGCTLLFKRPTVLDDIEDGHRFERLWNILEAAIYGASKLSKEDWLLLKGLVQEERVTRKMQDNRVVTHRLPKWLRRRAKKLRKEAAQAAKSGQWFLKEPNLHIVAPTALKLRSDLRFVMAVRHGVDMAFSKNQQQVSFWGSTIFGEPDLVVSEVASLRYWCEVHRRISAFQEREPDRVLILSFDQLCAEPKIVLRRLFEFSGVEPTDELINRASKDVKAPSSIGRRHNEDLSQFDPADMDFVESYMANIKCS